MQWKNLTPTDLIKAAKESGLAVLPVGSMEAHGDFLPLGNDTFKVDQACIDAAEQESAVVLPPQYFTDVNSMQMVAGAISVELNVLVDYMECLLDEIGRNGFRKILIVSGHGGNRTWLSYIRSKLSTKNKPYALYTHYMALVGDEANRALMETVFDGHGGEVETSIALHLFPELVHVDRYLCATEPAVATGIEKTEFTCDWTLAWPKAVCGDPRPANAEKGKVFYESCVSIIAGLYKTIKQDHKIEAFLKQFNARRLKPGSPDDYEPL